MGSAVIVGVLLGVVAWASYRAGCRDGLTAAWRIAREEACSYNAKPKDAEASAMYEGACRVEVRIAAEVDNG